MKHKIRVNKAVFTRCGVSPQAKSSSSAPAQDGENKESGSPSDASLLRIACACEDRTIILYDLEGKQVADYFSSLFSLQSSLFSLLFPFLSFFSHFSSNLFSLSSFSFLSSFLVLFVMILTDVLRTINYHRLQYLTLGD